MAKDTSSDYILPKQLNKSLYQKIVILFVGCLNFSALAVGWVLIGHLSLKEEALYFEVFGLVSSLILAIGISYFSYFLNTLLLKNHLPGSTQKDDRDKIERNCLKAAVASGCIIVTLCYLILGYMIGFIWLKKVSTNMIINFGVSSIVSAALISGYSFWIVRREEKAFVNLTAKKSKKNK